MYSFAFKAPDVVPVAFGRAIINLELTEKGPDIEIDYAEFLEIHRSMFIQPYLDEIAELAAFGAFRCSRPVSIKLSYLSTQRGRIEINGGRCSPAVLTAVLNLIDHMNRRGEHPGPYKAATIDTVDAVDAAPYPVALEKGEFAISTYGEFHLDIRGAALDPFESHDVQVIFKDPADLIDEDDQERFTGLYEGLNACGLWTPRADYKRWASAFSDDCEVSVHQYDKHGELDVRDHVGPLAGLLDLLRALGSRGGNVTVLSGDDEGSDD